MEIRLLSIEKTENSLKYNWSCSDGLKKYFTGNEFIIEYPENIESVPDGILAVPFAATVLPICWVTDSNLILPELDKDFYDAIPQIKQGFINMYPKAAFAGSLTVNSIIDCKPDKVSGTIVLFSGGVDATTTLLRHMDENPVLFSLWGADVAFENTDGWKVVERGIQESAKQYGLSNVTVHTMFRAFEDVMALTADFRDVLGTTWWYGIKHGIGIISHAAPYAWLHGIKTVYIASSNCTEDGPQQCASDPTIDNHVAFCGCRTVHDGFEMNRQDKIRFLVTYHKSHPQMPVWIRACWKAEDGGNCCACEKCYRTMAGFWVEGEDPRQYGFNYPKNVFKRMYQYIALHCNDIPSCTWTYMQRRLNENWDNLQLRSYRSKISWIRNYNFSDIESNPCRKKYQKMWILKGWFVKKFPKMYATYIRLRGYTFE